MRITSPRGFVPRTRGCNLPPEYAQHAENLNTTSGRFQPWRCPEQVLQFHEPIRVAHVSDCCWTGTHACGAHYIDAGIDKKTYLSGPGEHQPMVTADVCDPDWCALGYPVPDAPQLLPDTCDRLTKGPDTEQRTYRITYGTDCEEGPASCPTDPIMVSKGYRVGLILPPPPEDQWCATHVNIYRSQSLWDASTGLYGTEISDIEGGYTNSVTEQDYFLVARLPILTPSWVDQDTECEGKLLTTQDLLPPRAGSQVAGETDSGSLVIWHDRTLWFSERNKYWGFPLKTAHDFPDQILGVEVCRDSVVVMTCRETYVLSDAVECSESTIRVPVHVKGAPPVSPCSGKTGTVASAVGMNGVLYSSREGLVLLDLAGSYRVVSGRAFDKDSWNSLGPIRALTISGDKVILSTHQVEYLWVLSLDEQGLLPADLTTLSFRVDQWINEPDNALYFLVDNTIYEFDKGPEYMSMDWRQAEQVSSQKTRISAIKADYVKKNGQNKNKVEVYREGSLSSSKTLGDKGSRIRGSAAFCNQLRIRGKVPMCSISYGQGINNIDRGDRQ